MSNTEYLEAGDARAMADITDSSRRSDYMDDIMKKIEAKAIDGKDGYKLTRSTRDKISKAHTGKTLTEEHKAKISESQKGKLVSEETKAKISESEKGKIVSEETRRKIGDSKKGNSYRLGMVHSDETKLKISASLCGTKQKIVTCPHCYKKGGISNMKRWHFENCKLLPTTLLAKEYDV